MNRILLWCLFSLLSCACLAQTEGYVKIADGKMFYRTYGEGPPLLIINGGPGMNSEGFAGLATELGKGYRAIIYDQRGTGKSVLEKLDSTTITMQKMAQDMEALRRHLGIKKWTVMGQSFGGMLACYYATQFPQATNGLILSSSGGIDLDLLTYVGSSIQGRLSQAEKDSMAYWNQKISDGDTTHFAALRLGTALAPAYLVDHKWIPVIAERLTQGNSTINGLVWGDLTRIRYDCSKGLLFYKKPVLIIQGRQDIIQEETAEKAHAVLKNSRLVMMDQCSHYGWLDQPGIYYGEIRKFLTEVNAE